jgi:hypothetical protein
VEDSLLAQVFGNVPAGTRSRSQVLEYWLGVTRRVPENSTRVILLDRNYVDSVSAHSGSNALRPDLAGYPRTGGLQADFYMELVGVLKQYDGTRDHFTPEEKGQVAQNAMALFQRHPHRIAVYCFLASTRSIQFFRFERVLSDEMQVTYSEELLLSEPVPRKILLSLLNQPSIALGAATPGALLLEGAFPTVQPTEYLGRGSSAVTFAGQSRYRMAKSIVVKIYLVGKEHRLRSERQALEACGRVPELVGRVPRVLGTARCPANIDPSFLNVLVITPRGQPLLYGNRGGYMLNGN